MTQRSGVIALILLSLMSLIALILSILRNRGGTALSPELAARVDRDLTNQLRYQLVPYIVSAERLWRRPDYLLFAVYWYLEAVIAAVAGAGILPPLFQWSQFVVNPDLNNVKPPYLPRYAVVMAIFFILARIYIGKAGLEKRAVLAETCAEEFRELNTEVFTAATSGELKNKVRNAIGSAQDIVKRHQRAGSWPYNPVAPNITVATERRTAEIIMRVSGS